MARAEFDKLIEIMARLRSDQGCPWDREQNHTSLQPYLLEESYEVLEAIDNKDAAHLCEELGDLLLQIVFHAQIAGEADEFTIEDVVRSINEKLIRRHPHVFADAVINTSAEQKKHWERIKKTEGKKSALDGVPRELPALTRARRVQQKAASVGFDWEKTEQVMEKVREEEKELLEEISSGSRERIQEEFGDLLFALVNLARFLDLDPETSLRLAVEKFSLRFRKVEEEMKRKGRRMEDSTLAEMDIVWEEVKKRKNDAPASS